MNKTAQIANIIEKRQPLVEKISEVNKNLNSLTLTLSAIDAYREQLLEKVDDPIIIERLQEIWTLDKIELSAWVLRG